MYVSEVDQILYLISNLFRVYVVYRFMNCFFEKMTVNKWIKICGFAIYFIANSVCYLYLANPILNLMTNVIPLFLLTLMYKGKIFIRLIATALVIAVNVIFESVIYALISKIDVYINATVLVSIVTNLLIFAIVLIFEKRFYLKMSQKIQLSHWLVICLVPISSTIIVVVTFLYQYEPVSTIVIVAFLLGINIMVIYLYDTLIKYYENQNQKSILELQNNAYVNQLKIIVESQENMRKFKHDMNNHIYAMKDLDKNGKNDKLTKYFDNALEFIKVDTEYISSGNLVVDSIINYKIFVAKQIGVDINLKVDIPDNLMISDFDICVILGNLIDNAIEALRLVQDKKLTLNIYFEKDVLYISISNTYISVIKLRDNGIKTSQEDSRNHGIGLSNVRQIVDRNNGVMDISYDDMMFSVNLMIYS